jgi:acyl carrier protein
VRNGDPREQHPSDERQRDLRRPRDHRLDGAHLLAERFHRPLEEVTPDTDLAADLGVDSMDLIDVNISLEERFHLSMPEFATPEEVHVRTVRDLAALVSARLVPSVARKEPR